MQMLKVLCFIIFLVSLKIYAYVPTEGNVTAMFGPYFFKTDFKSAVTKAKSPYTTGLGLIANGDINDRAALEIAIFHMNKRFLRRDKYFTFGLCRPLFGLSFGKYKNKL
jgi:hypothetical protein